MVKAAGQERLTRRWLDEAVSLATRANPTLRAKQFEYQAVAAGEITTGLRPNPTVNFLTEQFAGASDASQTHDVLTGTVTPIADTLDPQTRTLKV